MSIRIKNCGLKQRDAIDAAIESGAHYLGFILYPPSCRYIDPAQVAPLLHDIPEHVSSVAVMVNPTDEELQSLISAWMPDMLQLHGEESPERIHAIRERFKGPIIKAFGVKDAEDIQHALSYEPHVEHLLLDAKDEVQKGGTGTCFDWSLLSEARFTKPWFLSGGLDAANVVEAISHTHAPMIDVSSGIESSRGVKNIDKIIEFNEIVRSL